MQTFALSCNLDFLPYVAEILSVCVCVYVSQDMLQAAVQYRDTKASLYRAAENAPPEPEYIPWTGKIKNKKNHTLRLLLYFFRL